ncbi:hypothetical protein ABFX02_08G001600 [Erythranthe guttata]
MESSHLLCKKSTKTLVMLYNGREGRFPVSEHKHSLSHSHSIFMFLSQERLTPTKNKMLSKTVKPLILCNSVFEGKTAETMNNHKSNKDVIYQKIYFIGS